MLEYVLKMIFYTGLKTYCKKNIWSISKRVKKNRIPWLKNKTGLKSDRL